MSHIIHGSISTTITIILLIILIIAGWCTYDSATSWCNIKKVMFYMVFILFSLNLTTSLLYLSFGGDDDHYVYIQCAVYFYRGYYIELILAYIYKSNYEWFKGCLWIIKWTFCKPIFVMAITIAIICVYGPLPIKPIFNICNGVFLGLTGYFICNIFVQHVQMQVQVMIEIGY